MTVLNRKLITRMVNPQPGGNGGGGGAGGAGVYVLPAASNSELGGIKLGYPTGTGKYYPVQLDSSQRAYVNVPWTDHYAWDDITGKPSFATVATSGSYNDLNNKPSIPSVSGSVSGSTLTITINGSSYSLTDTNTWRPVQNNLNSTSADDSLSAYQGYLLARGSARDDSKLPLTGGTMTGNLEIRRANSDDSHRSQIYVITPNDYPCDVVLGANNTQCWSWSARDSASAHSLLLWNFRTQESAMWVNGNTNNIGIGTQSPSYKLHVAGTIYATGSITERSDIRCKDVETYQWSPTLDMIADAPIIRYTMKDDKTHRMRVGSVAQYWEKVMPETVSKDNAGILSIAQGDICMVNVIALAREVRKLREKIIQLENGRS